VIRKIGMVTMDEKNGIITLGMTAGGRPAFTTDAKRKYGKGSSGTTPPHHSNGKYIVCRNSIDAISW
jgi:hypothetical protein